MGDGVCRGLVPDGPWPAGAFLGVGRFRDYVWNAERGADRRSEPVRRLVIDGGGAPQGGPPLGRRPAPSLHQPLGEHGSLAAQRFLARAIAVAVETAEG